MLLDSSAIPKPVSQIMRYLKPHRDSRQSPVPRAALDCNSFGQTESPVTKICYEQEALL